MVKPGDELAPGPAGPGGLRASHADRERVIDVLEAAFVQGCLTKDELDLRVSEAFASRTCAGLRVLTADLPPGLARPQPSRRIPEPDRQPTGRLTEQDAVRMIAAVLVAMPSAAFAMGLLEWGAQPQLSPAVGLLFIILFACIAAVPATGLVIFHSWLVRRQDARSSPAPPGAADRPAGDLAAADPARPSGAADRPAGRLAAADPARPYPRVGCDGRHGTAWAVLRILSGPPSRPAR